MKRKRSRPARASTEKLRRKQQRAETGKGSLPGDSRVSMQDVAERMGLSRSTVSLALLKNPRIPLLTRLQVEKYCKELGYRPNSIISELASSRWKTSKVMAGSRIAYIDRVQESQDSSLTETFGQMRRAVHTALHDQASRLGYQVEVFYQRKITDSVALQRTLVARGITEVILGPSYQSKKDIELDWNKFICVQLLPGFLPLPMHSVVRDHFNSVVLTWQKAVEYGYRRVGITLMKHPFPFIDDFMRMSATQACQNLLFPNLPVLPPFEFPAGNMDRGAFLDWAKACRPEVILGFNSAHYEFLDVRRRRSLAFACLNRGDDRPILSGVIDPSITCARESVNLIHFCRRTHQWGLPAERIDHVVEPQWHEGETMPRRS